MRRILIIAAFLICYQIMLGQSITKPDPRITQRFGYEYVDFLLKNNPDLIIYYNYYLDYSYYLTDIPEGKAVSDIPILRYINNQSIDLGNFNVLLCDVKRFYDQPSYYRIDNKQLLIFYSEKEFMKAFNEYRKQKGLIND